MRQLLPEPVTGYELEPIHGYFTFVKGEYGENLVYNPSVEVSLDGYFSEGVATITRTIAEQSRGAFSIKTVTSAANSGVGFAIDLSSGVHYTFSVDVKAPSGYTFKLFVYETSGRSYNKTFTSTGKWIRPNITFTPTSTGNGAVEVICLSPLCTFYTDGWQVEENLYPTTYIDGDIQPSLVNYGEYGWRGVHHNSISWRDSNSRSGGREYNLNDLGFHLTGVIGLTGMNPVSNIATPLSGGGSYYQNSIYTNRKFSLVGSIFGKSVAELNKVRNRIISIVKPSASMITQQMTLRYHTTDECGNPDGDVYTLLCAYSGGLEGLTDNVYQEKISIDFEAYSPYFTLDHDFAIQLKDSERTSPYNYAIFQNLEKPDGGDWEAILDFGDAGMAYDLKWAYNSWRKILYVFADRLAYTAVGQPFGKYIEDQNIWQPIGTYSGGDGVYDIIAYGNDVFVCGDFTQFAGISAPNLAFYDGTADLWMNIGGIAAPYSSHIYAMAYDPDHRRLWVGGDFSAVGGVTTSKIGYYEFGTKSWHATTFSGGRVYALYYYSGTVYAYADTIGATEEIYRGKNGTWTKVGTFSYGLTNHPGMDSRGNLFVVAQSGTAANSFMRFNGTSWVTVNIGTALNPQKLMYVDEADYVYLYVDANEIDYPQVLLYKDGVYRFADMKLENFDPGMAWDTPKIDLITQHDRSKVRSTYAAFWTDGTKQASMYNSRNYVIPGGDKEIYPVFECFGPLRIGCIHNYTNNKVMWWDWEYNVIPGDRAVLDTYLGVAQSAIAPPGVPMKKINPFDYTLVPGIRNNISSVLYDRSSIHADTYAQVSSVWLDGLDFDNTDNGILYMKVDNAGSVEFYKDSARSAKIAEMTGHATAGSYDVVEANSSGVSGRITINNLTNDDNTIYGRFGFVIMRWKEVYVNIPR